MRLERATSREDSGWEQETAEKRLSKRLTGRVEFGFFFGSFARWVEKEFCGSGGKPRGVDNWIRLFLEN